jgi:hypothetical protein
VPRVSTAIEEGEGMTENGKEREPLRHDGPPLVQAERAYIDHKQRKQYQRELFAIFFTHAPGPIVAKMAHAHRLVDEAPLMVRRALAEYLTASERVHDGSWPSSPVNAADVREQP